MEKLKASRFTLLTDVSEVNDIASLVKQWELAKTEMCGGRGTLVYRDHPLLVVQRLAKEFSLLSGPEPDQRPHRRSGHRHRQGDFHGRDRT